MVTPETSPMRRASTRTHRWLAVVSMGLLAGFLSCGLIGFLLLKPGRPTSAGFGISERFLVEGAICLLTFVAFVWLFTKAPARYFVAWSVVFVEALVLGLLALAALVSIDVEMSIDLEVMTVTGYAWGCLFGAMVHLLRTRW